MKNRLFYPAVFHKAEEGGFWVSFPDFPECMTQGDSMDEAYEMAIDALGLSLSSIEDEGTDIPKASEFETVDPEDGILVIIEFDMAEYRRKHRSKAVKKTLSIPEWLNEAAIRENWFSSHYGIDTHQTECGTIYYTYWYEEFIGN